MAPYGNNPSKFLLGTGNELPFSRLHHPFDKEQFFLVEEPPPRLLRRMLQASTSRVHMDG
ncbi:hypothetical protein DT250_03410 [Bacillus sp. AR2-1]|nr:hypothetical protein DT250_03410 [Bacillus sp. AR2-1]